MHRYKAPQILRNEAYFGRTPQRRKMRETQQMGVFQWPDRILLMGLGNILLGDEGVGIHAVHHLKERYHFDPPIEIVDGGTLGLDLLPFLENTDNALFVDAIDFGKEPGYVEEIEDGNIASAIQTRLSVHHIGLSDLLLAALWMDKKPKKICLIGIQPESLAMGLKLSESIEDKMEELVKRVIARLETWGITCASPSSTRG
jgi:hydrogenase maturation protease